MGECELALDTWILMASYMSRICGLVYGEKSDIFHYIELDGWHPLPYLSHS